MLLLLVDALRAEGDDRAVGRTHHHLAVEHDLARPSAAVGRQRREGPSERVGVLLRRGADPNVLDDDLDTPLHHARDASVLRALRTMWRSARASNDGVGLLSKNNIARYFVGLPLMALFFVCLNRGLGE